MSSGRFRFLKHVGVAKYVYIAGILSATVAGVSFVNGEAATPAPTIKDIMKAEHKGDDSVVKKIASGKGTPEEISKLLSDYKAMAEQDPPRGDKAAWKEKMASVIKATEGLKPGDEESVKAFKSAVSCKDCHQAFKAKAKSKQ